METTGKNINIIKRVLLTAVSYITLIVGFNAIVFYFLFALFIFREIEYSTLITCLCVIIMYDIYRLICKYCIDKYIPVNTLKVTVLLLLITIISIFLCYMAMYHGGIFIKFVLYNIFYLLTYLVEILY